MACGWRIALQKPLQERYVYVGQVSHLHKLQQRFGCCGVLTSILCNLFHDKQVKNSPVNSERTPKCSVMGSIL